MVQNEARQLHGADGQDVRRLRHGNVLLRRDGGHVDSLRVVVVARRAARFLVEAQLLVRPQQHRRGRSRGPVGVRYERFRAQWRIGRQPLIS